MTTARKSVYAVLASLLFLCSSAGLMAVSVWWPFGHGSAGPTVIRVLTWSLAVL